MKLNLPDILTVSVFDSRRHLSALCATPPRTVKKYELEYYFEDGGTSVLNGIEYKIKKGYILFAKPGDIRYSHLPFTCRFIHFTLSDECLISEFEKIEPFFYALNDKNIEDTFISISRHLYSANEFDNISACAELLLFLRSLIPDRAHCATSTLQAKTFIKNNYHNNISTKSVADACFTSESYLYKLFKKEFNITPGEYITNYRISVARDLLAGTDLSLTDISSRCGFNSQSYFSYCFKKHTGLSPKDFRRSYFL